MPSSAPRGTLRRISTAEEICSASNALSVLFFLFLLRLSDAHTSRCADRPSMRTLDVSVDVFVPDDPQLVAVRKISHLHCPRSASGTWHLTDFTFMRTLHTKLTNQTRGGPWPNR